MGDSNNSNNVYSKLLAVQTDLQCKKSRYNSFSDFNYRSLEDIIEAVKPLLKKQNLLLTCDTKPIFHDPFIVASFTATIINADNPTEVISCTGYAREQIEKKKMDSSQLSGAAASYAGKRALGNLFLLDDTQDADATNNDDSSAKIDKLEAARVRLTKAISQLAKQEDWTKEQVADYCKQLKSREDFKDSEQCYTNLALEIEKKLTK